MDIKKLENFINSYPFEKLHYDGWGLHPLAQVRIVQIIAMINPKRVIEFGSGGSTILLLDLRKYLNLEYLIDSFEHNKTFALNLPEKAYYLNMMYRELLTCSDNDYEAMFSDKKIYPEKFQSSAHLKNIPTAKNCFYQVLPDDLKGIYDLVILDGPHGNGRSLAYLHLLNHLKSGTFILIDDFDHYDFVERCEMVFKIKIHEKRFCGGITQDRFAVVQVL